MDVRNPRLRLLLGNHWRLIVAALVVLSAVALVGAGTTYADPPTREVTQQAHERTVETAAGSSARVTSENALWSKGTVLTDKPVYLLNATPTVDVTATTEVAGAQDARVTHEWFVTVRATRNGEQFYSETTRLARETHRGTSAETTAEIDVSAIKDRVGAIQSRIGTAGVVSAELGLRVTYRTDPGQSFGYTGNETYVAPLVLEPEAFAIGGDIGGRAEHSEPKTTTVTAPPDWGTISALALLALAGLGLAGGIVRLNPGEIDVEQARIDLHSTQYEEWISPGVIPMGISQQFIELESIEDVVDVAIDTNERVVYDRRRDLYAVIGENVVYYFSTGGSWMESAFRGMGPRGDGPEGGLEEGVFGGGGPDAGGGAGSVGGGDGLGEADGGAPADGDGPFGGAQGGGTDDGDDDAEAGPFGSGED